MAWSHAFCVTLAVSGSAVGDHATSPSEYEVLIGEGLVGSGFVIRHGGRLWGVTSIHQFAGKSPSRLESLPDGPGEIRLRQEESLRQEDVQALPLEDQSAEVQFLAYDPAFTLTGRDAVLILGPAGELVPATLDAGKGFRCTAGPRNLTALAERPFVASGGSGAPIVLASTGTVVGVLVSADEAEKARTVGLETLCLPSDLGAQAAGRPNFDAVVGRWTLDLEYAHELWKGEKGHAYDPAEWTGVSSDPENVTVDEIRLDEASVTYYKGGRRTVGYPVLGWTAEKGVVWVKARHFLGYEIQTGFLADGDRLKIVDRDGTWRTLYAFRRADPVPRSPRESSTPLLALVIAWGAIVSVGGAVVVVVVVVVAYIARRRMAPPVPATLPSASKAPPARLDGSAAGASGIDVGGASYNPFVLWRQSLSFRGRFDRGEFAIAYLGLFVATAGLLLALRAFIRLVEIDGALAIVLLGGFALLWPPLMLVLQAGAAVSRLRDLGHSGWLALLLLAPLVNILLVVYLLAAPGLRAVQPDLE